MQSIERLSERECTAIGRELGILDDVPVICGSFEPATDEKTWAGFLVEFVGTPVPTTVARPWRGSPTPIEPPPAVCVYEVDGEKVQVWRALVYHEGTQAYLEARAMPGWAGFPSVDLRDLDPLNRGENEMMLTEGLAILYPPAWRGRREGPALYPTKEKFHAALRQAYADLHRENRKPERRLLLEKLWLKKTQYSKLLKQWPLDE